MSNLLLLCKLCNTTFSTKSNYNRHANKEELCITKKELYELINNKDKIIEQLSSNTVSAINNNSGNVGIGVNTFINVKIEINPITKLQMNHIETDKIKHIIEKMDDDKQMVGYKEKFNNDKVNLLLSDYIKEMICDSEHPENHAVKYIKKKPPTYNALIEDADGNTVTVIKGLKDTCELLTDPILDQLKVKLKEFITKYKKDTEPDFDFILYENAIKELKKELNKQNVKKALSSVLKNDILNNIQMKLSIQPEEK